MFRLWILLALFATSNLTMAAERQFTPLFDGKTLAGWVQRGGQAKFFVEDGTIVGESVPRTPNSFLCTEETYRDFVLRYEFKCDAELNSGVQIRSNLFDEETTLEHQGKMIKIPAGRVHGYQVEIDPNQPDRLWAGGIYDEGRRGWLFPGLQGGDRESFTAQGKQLFQQGEWNRVRVRCQRNRIRTWLNGELRADFTDDVTAEGFIGLQVHGVGGREEPLRVQWRKIRIRTLD